MIKWIFIVRKQKIIKRKKTQGYGQAFPDVQEKMAADIRGVSYWSKVKRFAIIFVERKGEA